MLLIPFAYVAIHFSKHVILCSCSPTCYLAVSEEHAILVLLDRIVVVVVVVIIFINYLS